MTDPNEAAAAAAAPAGLVAALRRIFRPLVRLLIARAVPFPLASAILRNVYVEVAVAEFPVPGRKQTDSRVTLLTGVHRKDVKRLRGEPQAESRPSRSAALGTQLIARWLTQPEFLDGDGRPKALPRVGRVAGETSFESLVRSLNTDIRPRVVLDEWQRLGVVHLDEQDRVCLDTEGFVPARSAEDMAYFFGRNLHDHLAAAVHNLLAEGAPFLERSVNYNRLSPAAVAELSELAQERGREMLRELNARALELQQRDADRPDASQRLNVGVYLFAKERSRATEGSDE